MTEPELATIERLIGTPYEDTIDVAALVAEVRRLRAEVARLNPLTTLVGCDRCGNGVRNRDAVRGLCPVCADAEVARLRERADAGYELSTWAAAVRVDGRPNEILWIAGLMARVNRVQGLAGEREGGPTP